MFRLLLHYIIISILCQDSQLVLGKSCDAQEARKQKCGENEYCVPNTDRTGSCHCLMDYSRVDGVCVPNNPKEAVPAATVAPLAKPPDRHNAHVAVAIVVPFTLVLIAIGLALVVRRYNLVGWVRSKLHQRQTPYDEVMIGQDDDDSPLPGI